MVNSRGKKHGKQSTSKLSRDKNKIPLKPKMVTNWIHYSVQHRQRVREQFPSMTFGEHTQALSREWKCLSDEEKAPYTRLHAQSIAAYREKMNNLTPEEQKLYKSERRAQRKQKKKERTRLESLGLGEYPCSDYLLFSSANRGRFPGLSFVEVGKALGKAWRKLKDENPVEYENYRRQAREYREVYNNQKKLIENERTNLSATAGE